MMKSQPIEIDVFGYCVEHTLHPQRIANVC